MRPYFLYLLTHCHSSINLWYLHHVHSYLHWSFTKMKNYKFAVFSFCAESFHIDSLLVRDHQPDSFRTIFHCIILELDTWNFDIVQLDSLNYRVIIFIYFPLCWHLYLRPMQGEYLNCLNCPHYSIWKDIYDFNLIQITAWVFYFFLF
jgi:hypothetical protein